MVTNSTASMYWQKYYTAAEVAEIDSCSTTDQIVSGGYPIHLRLYERSPTAPTVITGHPMLPYGLMMARLHLPFYRAGYNVVQWDLPGWGESGGPRAACGVGAIIDGWRDVLEYAYSRYGKPVHALALAEDSVTCYYALANNPRVRAMSFHCLHEYGDPDGLHWQGPHWYIRLSGLLAGAARAVVPSLGLPAKMAFPWEAIFSGPGDEWLLQIFENDPLRVRSYKLPLAHSLIQRRKPPVSFERCTTPVQLIVSEASRMWPVEMNLRYFNRLGGPKEWVLLADMDQWSFQRGFQEMYAGLVMRWFAAHCATPV